MAPPEPLVGAALIARFMAAVAQVRPLTGEFESRRVRVNGQPGRLVRGPAEPQFSEAGRLATEQGLELLKADGDADQFVALTEAARAAMPAPQQEAGTRVWSVLTVDVVDGRIQTVRVVRNPDKLGHL
jgi:RNA polymerase sigma-70 factor (ECF subfamily)